MLFPRSLLTILGVAAFGAWHGFAYAMAGILSRAASTYFAGTRLNRETVRRLARGRLNRISQVMRRRGVLAMTAVRLVPLAPFAVVNVVAGAIHLRLRRFHRWGARWAFFPARWSRPCSAISSVTGLRDPRSINLWLVAALVLALIVRHAPRETLVVWQDKGSGNQCRLWRTYCLTEGSGWRERRRSTSRSASARTTSIAASVPTVNCNVSRVAEVIREMACDTVGLQEVDSRPGSRSDSRQLEFLATATGMQAVRGRHDHPARPGLW